MPNGVANFPDQCDPRSVNGGVCFCFEGNAELYPSPWQFRVDVISASPAYLGFIGQHLLPFNERAMPADSCIWRAFPDATKEIELGKVVFDPPLPGGITIQWELRFFPDKTVRTVFQNGFVQVASPLPALTLPPFTVTGADGTWADPVIATPRAWDYTL